MNNFKNKVLWVTLSLSLLFSFQFSFGYEYVGYRYPENNFPTFYVNQAGTPDCTVLVNFPIYKVRYKLGIV